MKNSMTRAFIGAGVAFAALLSLSAASWSMGPGMGQEHDPARMMAHMSDRLGLTEEQQAQVKEITAAGSENNAADRERLAELREQLHAMRDNFDAGKAQTIADEIGEITSRMVFQTSSAGAQVYGVLNEEQREKMDAMMKKREAHRGKWRKGRTKPAE